jgi:uncharacterized protein YdeI (YjbR/CyaY-like superfamily)
MSRVNNVEEYISRNPDWHEELSQLRLIFLTMEMEETIKWGMPTYTVNGKNVAGLGAFKSYVGIWFHNGALLQDKNKKLINAQEGKTSGLRQMRFSSAEDIGPLMIIEYINEAVENQRAGKEIKANRDKELIIPQQLVDRLHVDQSFSQNFKKLSKSKQREYAEYISEAKREETKRNRMEKIIPMINAEMGMNDRYS